MLSTEGAGDGDAFDHRGDGEADPVMWAMLEEEVAFFPYLFSLSLLR